MVNFLIFVFAVIGMTHIIVDGTIIEPIRKGIKKHLPKWFSKIVECYQCCGTWCGFILGAAIISLDPFVIIACGFAGSFLAAWGAIFLNYLEAKSVIEIPE